MKILTGLDVNENKSTLFFSKGETIKQQIADALHFRMGNLPDIYLGIPLSNNKLQTRDFGYLIDKVNKKFSQWTVKCSTSMVELN